MIGSRLATLARGSAALFFAPGTILGCGLWGILLAAKPSLAGGAAIALLAAFGMTRLLGLQQAFWDYPAHIYNPLLVGLALAWKYPLTPVTIAFIALAGAGTALITAGLGHLLWTRFRLPVLTLPFVLATFLATLAAPFYWGLPPALDPALPAGWTADPGWPLWLAGYFRSLGAVLFLPSIPVGLGIAGALLVRSRILFLLSVLGFLAGAWVRGTLLGQPDLAWTDAYAFNALFSAMAVGGIFLVPSPSAYGLALIAAALTALLQDALAGALAPFALPIFILPFNLVALGSLYVLAQGRHSQFAWIPSRTPEDALAVHQTYRRRQGRDEPSLALPFAGRWLVWQGFDGRWTHQGKWRFGYDFAIADETGRTHSGEGRRLHDYHAFRKPVLAPVRGRVARVVDGLPDNPPGVTDEINRWGNLVIIEDPRGFFVELSHFAANSILVKVGATVERGENLGLCGNSGYSPQPHIHVQTQATREVGAESRPFRFSSYAEGDAFFAQGRPNEGQVVEPLFPDRRLDQLTSFTLDESLVYDVRRQGRSLGDLRLTVRMASDGTLYFDSGRGQLYFGKYEDVFYGYRVDGNDPWLRRWSLAWISLPLAGRAGLTWTDIVPSERLASRPIGAALSLLGSLWPPWITSPARLKFVSASRIESEIPAGFLHPALKTSLTLDTRKGFSSATVGDLEFIRRDGPDGAARTND